MLAMVQAAQGTTTFARALQILTRAGLALESNGRGFQIRYRSQILIGSGYAMTADDVVEHVRRCLVR